MRLWHEKLIPYLPRQQLLGQHRECCALRGAGWGKPHATVNYVFEHPKTWLYVYHMKVMEEMFKRGYHADPTWFLPYHQGKNLPSMEPIPNGNEKWLNKFFEIVYPEHNEEYLHECLENLLGKGVQIDYIQEEQK